MGRSWGDCIVLTLARFERDLIVGRAPDSPSTLRYESATSLEPDLDLRGDNRGFDPRPFRDLQRIGRECGSKRFSLLRGWPGVQVPAGCGQGAMAHCLLDRDDVDATRGQERAERVA